MNKIETNNAKIAESYKNEKLGQIHKNAEEINNRTYELCSRLIDKIDAMFGHMSENEEKCVEPVSISEKCWADNVIEEQYLALSQLSKLSNNIDRI